MGVDTKGIASKDITMEEVVQAVKVLFDENAKSDLRETTYMNRENDFNGFISLLHNGKTRGLFVCKTEDGAEDTEYHRTLHTCFSLGHYGDSVEIMQKLISYFGGYVDDNDCDDIKYYKVDKGGTIHQPILEVTWDEIYEKFGRVVKIKNS